MLPLIELPEFDGSISASSQTQLQIDKIPQGYVYDGLVLEMTSDDGDFKFEDIAEISVRLGAKDIVEQLSGTQLTKINKYFQLVETSAATRGYLTIPFANIKAREYEAMRIGAVDTKSLTYNEFSMRVKPGGSQTGTNITLKAYGIIGGDKPMEDGEGRPLDTRPFVRALLKSTKYMGVAGPNEFTVNPGTSPTNLVRAAHLFNSYITHLEIKKDRVSMYDKMLKQRIQHIQTESGRSIQSGLLSFDAVLYGDEFEALSLLRDKSQWKNKDIPEEAAFKWIATCSQADTVTIISDIYSTIAGI